MPNMPKAELKPLGQIDFYWTYSHPEHAFDNLRIQDGTAKHLSLSQDFRGPFPRTLQFEDLADWMSDHDIKVIGIERNDRRFYFRALIGRQIPRKDTIT
jgi:hypothetical protein